MKSVHRIILAALNVVLAVYLVLAVTALNRPDDGDKRCNSVEISVDEGAGKGFLTSKDIEKMLNQKHMMTLGNLSDSINLRQVEDVLKSSALVKDAEASMTDGGTLKIDVSQRVPLFRVKTYTSDYYVDDSGNVMPSSPYQSDVIIATGYITKYYAQHSLFPLINALNADELWHHQTEQLNVLANHGVELVPRVGNHIVYLGKLPSQSESLSADSISDFVLRKLSRLEKFYRFGLSKVGWDNYSYINLEYDNQIICKK